jgi:predicted transcriptional regulator
MNVTINQPKPHNLREQVIQQISAMPENDVAQVYELLLLAEKLRLRSEISKQAEAENERGTWLDLPELIAAYRAQKKPA